MLDQEILDLLIAGWINESPVTGDVDLSGGFEASAPNYSFGINYDNAGLQGITLDANYADGVALVTALQSKIDIAIGSDKVIVSINATTGFISFAILLYHSIELTVGGVNDFLVEIGIAADTYDSEIPFPKKVLLNNPDSLGLQPREVNILSEESIFSPNVYDGSDDLRTQSFTVTGLEGNRTDAGKMIAAVKRILKRATSVINGTFLITKANIPRGNNIGKWYLYGNNEKILEDDEY